mmetsp:Transcript_17349/g.19326  ORF Transcript_17349/g.19326 Transcript_17349/m.19326 type:complete len:139 (+) Transcript_17349:134-550(+)
MCDLANLCMMYHIPSATMESNSNMSMIITGLKGIPNLSERGILLQNEVLEYYYCALVLKDNNATTSSFQELKNWFGFYFIFLFFKNCVIVQGVAQRSKRGVASSAIADNATQLLLVLVAMINELLRSNPIPSKKQSKL